MHLALSLRTKLLGWKLSPSAGMALAAAFSLLALGLRLYRLGQKDIWWDEGWSIWMARRDVASIALEAAAEVHPPLHYEMLHFWIRLVGEGEFAVRFFSVFFGVLTVALLYRFGSELAGRGVGLMAALLLSSARFHVWWSQEIKMYALAIFLGLLSLHFFVRAQRDGRLRYWLGYALATLACLLTLYLTLLVVVVENLAFLLWWLWGSRGRRWSALAGWAGVQVGIALTYLPWFFLYLTHAYTWQKVTPFDLGQALRLYVTILPLGVSTDIEQYAPLVVLLTGLAVIGLVAGFLDQEPEGRQGAALLGLCVLAMPVAFFLFTLPERGPYRPEVEDRYMILFLPVYMLLLAWGVAFFWQRTKVLAGVLLATILLVFMTMLHGHYWYRQSTDDLRVMAHHVTSNWQEGDAVLVYPDDGWPVYLYYLGEVPWYPIPYGVGAPITAEEAERWLAPAMAGHLAIWVITDLSARQRDPQHQVPSQLEAHLQLAESHTFGSTRLTLYAQMERTLQRQAQTQ